MNDDGITFTDDFLEDLRTYEGNQEILQSDWFVQQHGYQGYVDGKFLPYKDSKGNWTIGSGVASLDGSQSGWESLQNNADGASRDFDINTTHRVKYTYTRSAGAVQYKDGGGQVTLHNSGSGGSEDLVHVSAGTYWYFTANADFVGTLDNIEVYPLNGYPGVMTNMALTDYTGDTI